MNIERFNQNGINSSNDQGSKKHSLFSVDANNSRNDRNVNKNMSINSSSNNQISSENEIDMDFLMNIVDNNSQERNMVQKFKENFGDKFDKHTEAELHQFISNKDLANSSKFFEPVEKQFLQSKRPRNNCNLQVDSQNNSPTDYPPHASQGNKNSQNESLNYNSNSNSNENITNSEFGKMNQTVQLDDRRLHNLKYNLMNTDDKNGTSTEKEGLGAQNSNNLNLNVLLSLVNEFPNDSNGTSKNIEDFYIKTFILSKVNQILSGSSLPEKLVLYDLISSNKNKNPNNLLSGNNNISKLFS